MKPPKNSDCDKCKHLRECLNRWAYTDEECVDYSKFKKDLRS